MTADRRGDLRVVALAAAAWAGAVAARPVPAPVLVVTAVVLVWPPWRRWVIRRTARTTGRWSAVHVDRGVHRRWSGAVTVARWALVLAVVTSGLGARSLAGLVPPAAGPVEATLVLVTDPDPTTDGRLRFDARWRGRRVLAEASAPAAVAHLTPRLAGERVVVRGVVTRFDPRPDWATGRHLAAELSVESVVGIGDGAPHAAVANGLRRLLQRGAASLPDGHRALLAGLTLGDERGQPPELAADFRSSGLTHLLAVSGQNVAFLLAIAAPLLGRLGLWSRFLTAVSLVAGFAFLTRFEPSVVRAAVVATVALWAVTTGRASGGARHLGLAVCGLLVVDPLLTRSVGFRLSVAACAGVLALAPSIVRRLPGPRWFREGLGVTAGAQLAVAPVLVPTFGAMPVAALPANIAAGPLAGFLMVWGVTAGVVAGVAGGSVAWLLHRPSALGLALLERVSAVGASLPLGHVDLRHVAVLGLAALLWRGRRPALRVGAGVLVVLALVAPLRARVPPGPAAAGWAATVWSDGPVAVVDVDAGASPVEVLDVLRARRVHTVGLVVVRSSRPELGAVVEAVRARFPVGGVLVPAGSPVPGAVRPTTGFRARVGGFVVEVDRTAPALRARIGWARRSSSARPAGSPGGRGAAVGSPRAPGARAPPLRRHPSGHRDGHPQPHPRLVLRRRPLLGLRRLPPQGRGAGRRRRRRARRRWGEGRARPRGQRG